MIIVTLGTQKFQMDRLLRAIDELAPTLQEEIFIQTGNSTYEPKNCKYQNFVDVNEFQKMIEECSILITHSGVGTIMRGIRAGKPVVVVPRQAKYHEHVDDHQVQIAEAFAEKGCVLHCEDTSQLAEMLERAKTFEFKPYAAPENNIQDLILEYISLEN